MPLIADPENVFKEESAVIEEDYSASSMEEMKERSEPQFYDESDLPELTVILSKPSQKHHRSKMIIVDSDDEESDEEAADLLKMSKEPLVERAYGYGHVGERMQKRIPLKQPFEQMLQEHMVKLKHRIMKKIRKYTRKGNNLKLRKYQREKWAIEGMQNCGLEF